MSELRFLELGDRRLATCLRAGTGPATLLFLPGYASDMDGTKAVALDGWAAESGLACGRFDYGGTGSSPGRFEDGTLDGWLEDALAVADRLTEGPLIVVGSSMGGWLALHLALHRPERVRGLLGIAAAPDFTDWGFGEADRLTLREAGRLERPSPYGGQAELTTHAFWQSGQRLLLGTEITVTCPVRLIHGDLDSEVPLEIALRTKDALRSADVQLWVIKGGGHRLSAPNEIRTILRAAEELLALPT